MEIGLTEGLRKFARLKPLPKPVGDDLLFCWDASRVQDGGRTLLVLANASNRACAITRMSGTDWGRIDSIVPDLVRAALESCGLHSWDIETYMEAAGEAVLTKTHGAVPVGGLNRVCNSVWFHDVDMSEKVQRRLTGHFNCSDPCTRAGREGYGYASEWLLDDMMERGLLEGFGDDAAGAVGRNGVSDIAALRKWTATDDRVKNILLSSAFCHQCGDASFAPGWTLRDDRFGFVVEGTCSKCGGPIARCSW